MYNLYLYEINKNPDLHLSNVSLCYSGFGKIIKQSIIFIFKITYIKRREIMKKSHKLVCLKKYKQWMRILICANDGWKEKISNKKSASKAKYDRYGSFYLGILNYAEKIRISMFLWGIRFVQWDTSIVKTSA